MTKKKKKKKETKTTHKNLLEYRLAYEDSFHLYEVSQYKHEVASILTGFCVCKYIYIFDKKKQEKTRKKKTNK